MKKQLCLPPSTYPLRLLIGMAILSLFFLFGPGFSSRVQAATIYVDDTASGANNGSTWLDAYPKLQDALATAASGDEIWVATGVYYPDSGGGKTDNDRTASFQLKNNLAIYGGFAGTEVSRDQRAPTTNLTILSGDIDQNDTNIDGNFIAETWNDIQGTNANHVVVGSNLDGTSVLDGFILTAGRANDNNDGFVNCPADQECGGGIYLEHSSPMLVNLIVTGNRAIDGGGLDGFVNSSPSLTNVRFVGNLADNSGGGIYNYDNSSPILTNVTLNNNKSGGGGGITNVTNSNPTLTNVTFSNNQSNNGAGLLDADNSNPILVNVTFSANQATDAGGGIRHDGGILTLKNVTFNGNQAAAGGAISQNSGTVNVTNSIFAASTGNNCTGMIASGDYNLSSDATCNLNQAHDQSTTEPKLELLADNNGRTQTHGLQDGSPAIDAGNCSGNTVNTDQRGVTRPQGPGCDIGAFEKIGATTYDWGDAPDPTYPTLRAHNGARHGQVSNRHLGTTVTADADGQPNADASGDGGDDGVNWPATLNACEIATINVTASATGLLNAWVDFNANGDWRDAGEQIFRGLPLNAGTQPLKFFIPCDAKLGVFAAVRLRFSGEATLGVTGAAFDGEVEDYMVAFERGGPLAQADFAQLNEDQSLLLNVLQNDTDPVGGPLLITALTPPARGTAVIEGNAIRYTPQPDYNGPDSFRYTIRNEVNKEATALVTVNVHAVNDPPTDILLSNAQVTAPLGSVAPCSGNIAAQIICKAKSILPAFISGGTTIGKLSTVDPDRNDTATYFITGPADTHFAIAGDELRTKGLISVDANGAKRFEVVVKSQDRQGATVERSFTIALFGPKTPDDPIGISLSSNQVGENQPAQTIVGTLSTLDPKSNNHTYALVSGAGSDDNTSFTLDGATIKTTQALDYEAKESYSVRVRSTNDQNKAFEQNLIINVVDDNSEPGEPTPKNCNKGPIKLMDTANATIEVTDISVTNSNANGCDIQGKLHVRITGSEVTGIAFSGRVDGKNQLYSEKAVAAQNANPQIAARIGAFNLAVAGLTVKISDAKIEYYLGKPSLRLTKASWCAPSDWGGLCASTLSDMLIDSGGLKTGGSVGFLLPDFILGKAASKVKAPRLLGLMATLKPVAGGYEITAAGQFGIPKLPAKTGAGECGLSASLTIYVDSTTGATVMKLNATASPQTSTATDGAALREVNLSLECSQGIPIDETGLQLTGVRGTLSLRPGEQFVSLGVTVETLAKAGPFTLAKVDGDAKLLWDPQWGFDLVATIKLLGFLEASKATMNLRENRFHFDGFMQGSLTRGEVRLDAWTGSGSKFYLTGTGKLILGIPKGALYHSDGLGQVTAAQDHAGLEASKVACCGFSHLVHAVDNVVDTVKDVGNVVIDTTNDTINAIEETVHQVTSIDVPPIDLTVGSMNSDFGRFTNGDWGIKAYIQLSDVVQDIGQDILNFFHVPTQFGAFINSQGELNFGSVTKYSLVTPPPIQAALQRWQVAKAKGAAISAAADQSINVISANEMIIKTPLTSQQPTVQAATVISQVRVSAPATVNFMLGSYEPQTMTLIAPDGTHITPVNYNDPSISQQYGVKYAQKTIYELFEATDKPSHSQARLRFIPTSNNSTLAAVDVLVDGVPLWKNVKPFSPALRDPDYSSDYVAIEPGLHTINVVPTGQSTAILSTTLDARLSVGYTLFTAGTETPELHLLTSEQSTPPSFGQAYARFVDLSDANRKINVKINGVVVYNNLSALSDSSYQLLPAGDVKLQVEDATTGVSLAPARVLPLRDTSIVFTFFLFDHSTGDYPLDFSGTIDDLYLPRIYSLYNIAANMGDWQVDVSGDLSDPGLSLAVIAYADPIELHDITLDANNLSQSKVNWTLKSEFAPTRVTLFANPGDLTSPFTYTNTNNVTVTESLTNFMGIQIAQVTLTDPSQLNNAAGTLTTDLTKLESGTYRFWLEADDGVNPPRKLYIVKPGTQALAVVTVDNGASFPQTWTPTITPTIDLTDAMLEVQWTGLNFPDIDSYNLNLGTIPGAAEWTDGDISPIYPRDVDGNSVGDPLGMGRISNIEPNKTYYLFVEAVDNDSGRVVKSQTISFTASAGEYTLTSPVDSYKIAAGGTMTIPISLQVTKALFQPDVFLGLDDEDIPRGIHVQFANDLLGETSLHAASNAGAVTAAGLPKGAVLAHDASPAHTTATTTELGISVDKNVKYGTYHLTITGYNVQGLERSLVITFEIVAPSAFQSLYLPMVVNNPGQMNYGLYLPVVMHNLEMVQPLFGPTPLIAPHSASKRGEIFYKAPLKLTPATLPAGGHFYLSSAPHELQPILVDDQIALLKHGEDLFVHTFPVGSPTLLEVPRSTLEVLSNGDGTIEFRDIGGLIVSATNVWLVWTP